LGQPIKSSTESSTLVAETKEQTERPKRYQDTFSKTDDSSPLFTNFVNQLTPPHSIMVRRVNLLDSSSPFYTDAQIPLRARLFGEQISSFLSSENVLEIFQPNWRYLASRLSEKLNHENGNFRNQMAQTCVEVFHKNGGNLIDWFNLSPYLDSVQRRANTIAQVRETHPLVNEAFGFPEHRTSVINVLKKEKAELAREKRPLNTLCFEILEKGHEWAPLQKVVLQWKTEHEAKDTLLDKCIVYIN
jgi:hypothetical protein